MATHKKRSEGVTTYTLTARNIGFSRAIYTPIIKVFTVALTVRTMQGGVDRRIDERGLTPAVGVLLVAALVLVLAATAGGLFLAFAGDSEEPPPTVSFDFTLQENSPSEFGAGADGNLTISFEAGDTFDPENVQLVFDDEPENFRDGFTAVKDEAPQSGQTLANLSGVSGDFTDRVGAGERLTIPFNADNTVQVVWAPDDETSSVLDTFEGPGRFGPKVEFEAESLAAGEETTHTWTLSKLEYGDIGRDSNDNFDETGDEVDSITVSYPLTTDFNGIDQDDVTVTMTRTLAGGPDTDEISVNNETYEGFGATIDLFGGTQTDVAGPIEIEIDGIKNPIIPGEVEITLDGDAGEKTVTETIGITGGDPISPNTAGEESVHTWVFDDLDFDSPGGEEVNEITVNYENGSFDGLNQDDITVVMTRTLAGGEDVDDISVNSGTYSGSEATFDLSGQTTTDVAGPLTIQIDGIDNPEDSGTYDVEFTFEGYDDEETTVTRELEIEP